MWKQISDPLIESSFSMYLIYSQSVIWGYFGGQFGVYVYLSHLGVAPHISKFTLMDAQDTKIFNDEYIHLKT